MPIFDFPSAPNEPKTVSRQKKSADARSHAREARALPELVMLLEPENVSEKETSLLVFGFSSTFSLCPVPAERRGRVSVAQSHFFSRVLAAC